MFGLLENRRPCSLLHLSSIHVILLMSLSWILILYKKEEVKFRPILVEITHTCRLPQYIKKKKERKTNL